MKNYQPRGLWGRDANMRLMSLETPSLRLLVSSRWSILFSAQYSEDTAQAGTGGSECHKRSLMLVRDGGYLVALPLVSEDITTTVAGSSDVGDRCPGFHLSG